MQIDPATLNGLLGRMVMAADGGFSPEHARYVLSLEFPADQHALFTDLSVKAQKGTLTASEQQTLDTLLFADAMLSIMQLKARTSLGERPTQHQPAA